MLGLRVGHSKGNNGKKGRPLWDKVNPWKSTDKDSKGPGDLKNATNVEE